MSLAALLNVPDDRKSWLEFSFANQDQHRLITLALQKKGVSIPEYIIDQIPNHEPKIWLQIHQEAHNAFGGVLGIAGNDLSTLDVNQIDQMNAWVRLHFSEHQQAAQLLGL